MNGGQIVAQVLKAQGINHLYTLSGGHIAPIYVEADKGGIRIVDVRHEATAVFAADAMGRLSGVPGVAVVTAGPGVTNTITALKNAQLAQSPLLVIGGAAASLLKGRGALQDIDQMALVEPHVKKAFRITTLKSLEETIHTALNLSRSGVPGPVFVECPVDLLYDESIVRGMYDQNKPKGKSIRSRMMRWYIDRHVNRIFGGDSNFTFTPFKSELRVSSDDLRWVHKNLYQSKQPIFVIGSGAIQNPVIAHNLAETILGLGVPCYLSGMARGLLGRDCSSQFYHKRRNALQEADLILLAGVPCDFRLDYGNVLNKQAIKIAISKNPDDLKKNLRAERRVHIDPGQFIIELANLRTDNGENWDPWKRHLKVREEKREEEISEMSKEKIESINPIALFRLLESRLPEKSIIVVDGGDFAATASYTLRPRAPLKWLDPGVFGTLGVGGGFALGAALHYPDHYIWIIYGDGSSTYSLAEFDTFKKFGLKVCGIIGNNGSWEQIAREQIPLLGRDTASNLPQSDYERIGFAFGAAGEKVESLESFSQSINKAIHSMDENVPFIINALIGSSSFRKGSISM